MTDSLPSWYVLAVLLPSVIFGLLVYVWTAIGLGAVFAKLGVERWKAWVPVYNQVVLLGLGGLSGWLLLLLLIPVFGPIFVFVAVVTAAHRINAAFGHGAGMTVLAALLFPVWASVLGFGASRPVHPVPGRSSAREARGGDDLQSFSAQFDRGHDDLAARRSVPSPSAWIPPAPPMPTVGPSPAAAPAFGADVAPAPAWGEPYRAPAAAVDPFVVPAADPYVAPAVDPYATLSADVYAAAVQSAPATDPSASPGADPYAPPGADPYAPPGADPYAPPGADPYAPPAAEPETPAPQVMSWWQPAIVEEADESDRADDAGEAAVDIPDWARPVPPAQAPAADAVAASAPPTPEAPVAPADAPVAESSAGFAPPASPPVLRESYLPESDAFPEASGEVSAVVGSPTAGPPRSATASVSASRPGVGDFVEDTVIASRRRPKWALLLPDGTPFELSGDSAVLGRRPVPVHSAPGAQLVLVVDETRTVSKTHALLRRRADVWMIADLGSTNGVVVLEGDAEVEVAPGVDREVQGTFLLGDAVLRLMRADA
ncbi:DUF5684 domain-containing protein [Microbacterium sp. 18062]|uniref:DUF5684 domain-containing protein n=1 Tax=Microbacterium sp. 18062 TaxID=2681410 RepID=UPI001356AD8E|nr:DUF5684 domain-containing protein [Microbacterium sp. 18062]